MKKLKNIEIFSKDQKKRIIRVFATGGKRIKQCQEIDKVKKD